MNRRSYLKTVGVVGTLGVIGTGSSSTDPLAVKIWFSEAASKVEGLYRLITPILRTALESAGREVEIAPAETPIRVGTDYRRMMRVHWPKLIGMGHAGVGPVDPVRGINLLVTDGDVRREVAGYGMPSIASVSGARHLAALPERPPKVVDHSLPGLVAQLLLHECGHALRLTHRHGSLSIDGDVAISSPMTSLYPWKSEAVRRRHFSSDRNRCGEGYPVIRDKLPRLRLRYSNCSRRHIVRQRFFAAELP